MAETPIDPAYLAPEDYEARLIAAANDPNDKRVEWLNPPPQTTTTDKWRRDRFPWVTRTDNHPILGTGVEMRRSLLHWLIASKP